MKVLPEVQAQVDHESVVFEEFSWTNRLLPPRWSDLSLAGSEAEVARWFRSLLRREIAIESEETVLTRKEGRGARPVAVLGLKERLIYRATVQPVRAGVGIEDRSADAYRAFVHAPLESQDCRYVLKTDVASFYQYIDHERLVQEIVAQTGDDLAVMTTVDLLYESSRRRFGLPQVSNVSDVLANVYIEPIRRQLVRSGYQVWRFSDDFRVACQTYGDALAALEVCDEAARDLGLVLSERKTSTPKRDTYERSLTETARLELSLLRAMSADDEFDPFEGSVYDEEAGLFEWAPPFEDPLHLPTDLETDELAPVSSGDDGEPSDEQIEAAHAVLRLVRDHEQEVTGGPSEFAERLLRNALAVLTQGEDPEALDKVSAILVYQPSLTPLVAGYMRACSRTDASGVRRQLNKICRRPILSAWQALWLAYLAGDVSPPRAQREPVYVHWLRSQMGTGPAYVRAEAALAAARLGHVGAGELLSLLPTLPKKHRPTVLIGLAVLGATGQATDASDSELDRLRIDWADRHLRR